MKSTSKFLLTIALVLCVSISGCQPKPSPNSNTSAPSKIQSTLSIEAGLVYKSGDVKPVARNEFYLLDDDAEKIIKEAGVEKKGRLKKWKEISWLDSYAAAKLCVNRLTRCPALKDAWDLVNDVTEALKPHIVKSLTTGFDGKASFEPVTSGTYYVMGIYLRDEGFVSWNVKVELNSASQQLILDQNNSSMIYQPSAR
jgi:uncharacterized lipoprotein YehR (DUF1307 family)